MQTNANSPTIAALLASCGQGTTFTGLVIRKQGVVRGGKRYDDDLVHAVFVTGFNYKRLIVRSLNLLSGIKAEAVVKSCAKNGELVTVSDVEAARGELFRSFEATLAGRNSSTCQHVFDPLVVDQEVIRSGRVYRCVAPRGIPCHCRKCSGRPTQPVNGMVYIRGLKVWSKVLEAAPNGHWTPRSSCKTKAKRTMREMLPVGRFCQYRLEPGENWILRAGGVAELEATQKGFVVTDALVTDFQNTTMA